MRRWSDAGAILLITLAIGISYGGALDNYFVEDDFGNITLVRAGTLAWLSPLSGVWSFDYRPMKLVAEAVKFALFGERASLHALFNLVVHGLNTVMVYLVGVRLLGRWAAALVAALAFATFHAPSTVVFYNAMTNDTGLSVLCGLLSLLCFDRYLRRPQRAMLVVSWASFTAALYFKEIAAVWLGILWLWEQWPHRREAHDSPRPRQQAAWAQHRTYLPFLASLVLYLGLHWIGLRTHDVADLPLITPYGPGWGTVANLMRWTFAIPLLWVNPELSVGRVWSLIEGVPLVWLLPLVGTGWLIALLLLPAASRFLAAWYGLSLLPMALCGRFFLSGQYIYFPSAALFLLLVGGVAALLQRIPGVLGRVLRTASLSVPLLVMSLNIGGVRRVEAFYHERSAVTRQVVQALRSAPPDTTQVAFFPLPRGDDPEAFSKETVERMVEFARFPPP